MGRVNMSIITVRVIDIWYRFMISWSSRSRSDIGRSSITSPHGPSVWELSSSAGEDVSASSNHVFGPGKLLAVENKCISILPKACVADSALLLQSLQSVPLVINLLVIVINATIVLSDAVIVVCNSVVIVINAVFKVVDLVVQVDKRLPDSFKGNHQLCLCLDSIFVVLLVPGRVPLVVGANLIPEVSGWNITIGLRCITHGFIGRARSVASFWF